MRFLYNIHGAHAREKSVNSAHCKKKGPVKTGPDSKLGKFICSDNKEFAETRTIIIVMIR